jgi:hypothetical protein
MPWDGLERRWPRSAWALSSDMFNAQLVAMASDQCPWIGQSPTCSALALWAPLNIRVSSGSVRLAAERLTWRTGPLNRPGSPEGARSAIGLSRGVGADAEWTSRIASLCR